MADNAKHLAAESALLATKRFVPRPRANMVSRPRLAARLQQGSAGALTLVAAPAGSGKTSLLADWLAGLDAAEWATAWVSLDAADNDPLRFWTYVFTALHAVEPGAGETGLALLQTVQPAPITSLLKTVINDLAAISRRVVLVLDDYHVIQSSPIHEGLAFLIDHLPPQAHLVLASREDPPLPLPRLRARGQLTEIRAADLRFTPDEAATFLNTVMELGLAAGDIAALESRTEGWIAGLQLAALSVQGQADVSGFIRSFAGDDRYIVDYLVDEVLQHQPADIRTFLLETAILERLSGPLCDAVTGRSDGAGVLETLERGNLFVVPLDRTRRWYRYHHLFADVLRARLLAEHPGLIAVLHQRASAWFAREGALAEAIRHALAGKDVAHAANLVELATPDMRRTRQEATLLGWYRALPGDVFPCRPVLSAGYASTMLSTGELDGVEERLRDAERWLAPPTLGPELPDLPACEMTVVDHAEFQRLPGEIAVFRAGQALALGDLAAAVTHARRALGLVEPGDLVWRGAASSILGLAAWGSGDLAAAYQAYAEGMAHLQRAGNIPDAIAGAVTLADIRLIQGRLRDAQQTYEQALQLADGQGTNVLRGAADMHVGLSVIHREWGDLETAARHLHLSKDLGEPAGFPQFPYRWCVAMARLLEAEGDLDGALEQLHEAERRYAGDFSPNVRPIRAMMVRIWLVQGRLGNAFDWVREQALSATDDLSYLQEFAHITLARVLLVQAADRGDDAICDQALGLLQRLQAAAEVGERWGSVLDILVLQALAEQQRGNLPAAMASLGRALALAEPDGYLRTFVDEGDALRQLLLRLSGGERDRPLTQRLLVSFGEPALPHARAAHVTSGLVEPLTARETEILRLIAAGLRNQEIADQLFISLPTVKRHLANAYGKLEVSHRTEAIARANALKLL